MSTQTELQLDFGDGLREGINTSEVSIDCSFPESEADQLATVESFNKHLYRPNTYLHKWWARRSGTTFRHILKQLVDNPNRRDFYAPGGLEGKVILDPMMGGGTTLHEAIRMGANVAGVDIDPIPLLQAKSSLSLVPPSEKRQIFSRFMERLRATLSPLYRTNCPTCGEQVETQFLLYALRRQCSCREALFADSLVLREGKDEDVRICDSCHEVYTGRTHNCVCEPDRPLLVKGVQRCERCEARFVDLLDLPFVERYVPLVVVGICPRHNQFFKRVDTADLALLAKASSSAKGLTFSDPEGFHIPTGPKSDDLQQRHIMDFRDLFTPRQLLYLNTSLALLRELSDEHRLWLGLLISTSLEFNSLLCGYKGAGLRRPGAIRHVFSHHAYSFPYTALENNPVLQTNRSGTLKRLFDDRILKAARWALAPAERRTLDGRQRRVVILGEVDGGERVSDWRSLSRGKRKFLILQADSAKLEVPEGIVDYVITDPPYYDNVQYSDLSNFFRAWLRLLLPEEVDWRYDQSRSAVSQGDAGPTYGRALSEIWRMCFRALKKERGRLIFTFHHWNPEAWAELTLSLRKARFLLVNRYVVSSENPISVHIRKLKALKHDTILVLRPNAQGEPVPTWAKPVQISTNDSYAFCRDCGAALGWFLASDLPEEHIRRQWDQLIVGNRHAKTSR